jgi:hypothetical protein
MKTPVEIINELIPLYTSMRDMGRAIGEDGSDIIRWRYGKTKIKARAVIAICRLHPEITPHQLNPDIFPADLRLTFGDNK